MARPTGRHQEPYVPYQNDDILSLPGLVAIALDYSLEFSCASDRDFALYSVYPAPLT